MTPAHIITAAALSTAALIITTTSAGDCPSAKKSGHSGQAQMVLASHTQGENAGKDIIETALAAGSFTTLATALTEADLVSALKGDGPFTVFAPTDEAFAKLPKATLQSLLRPENRERLVEILTYHVVPGELDAKHVLGAKTLTTLNGQRVDIDAEHITIDGAKITATDIECSNGVIHVIDTVIVPQADSILEVAASAGSFSTLAAALKAADLVDALSGDGPFTVLAPTDEAFAALPEGTLDSLLRPENKDKLRSILLYHVIEGRVYADQAIEAKQAHTLQGGEVSIRKSWEKVKINEATVQSADVEASNGVIHVIDRVILPQG